MPDDPSTENSVEAVIFAGEGLTYIYWEPIGWDPDLQPADVGDEHYDWPLFMKVADMEALWNRPDQGVVGTKTNKIIMATGTDPARYEVDTWADNLGKYKLILTRHEEMPIAFINQCASDRSLDDVTITGVHFDGDAILKIAVSDQGFLLEYRNFKVPPGGYKMLVTGRRRRQEDETVTIDMWPSVNADDPDEVLRAAQWH